MFYGCSYRAYPVHTTLIKKKIKFSSYMRKFGMKQLQRHIVDTSSKFATGINNTNQRNWWQNLPPVSLIPVVHLDLRISLWILKKIRNGPNGILWGWGETLIHEKIISKKSRDAVPLTVPPCSSQRLPVLSFLVYGHQFLKDGSTIIHSHSFPFIYCRWMIILSSLHSSRLKSNVWLLILTFGTTVHSQSWRKYPRWWKNRSHRL